MILSGHQPYYFPAPGLLNKIMLSDVFIFADQCEFQPGSWHNRTRIARPGGGSPLLLTIPCVHDKGQNIDDTEIGDDWFRSVRRKHLRTLELAYGNEPYFEEYFDKIAFSMRYSGGNLSRMNAEATVEIWHLLGIERPFFFGRELGIRDKQENKTDMLIDMCRAAGADAYLSNRGATYVDEARMAAAGIKHLWQEWAPLQEPELSVIDLLFKRGPEAGEIVKSRGRIA